jgi:hypothetical protein
MRNEDRRQALVFFVGQEHIYEKGRSGREHPGVTINAIKILGKISLSVSQEYKSPVKLTCTASYFENLTTIILFL